MLRPRSADAPADYLPTHDFNVSPPATSVAIRQLLYNLRRKLEAEGWLGTLCEMKVPGYLSNVQMGDPTLFTTVVANTASMANGATITVRWKHDKIQYKRTVEGEVKLAVNGFRCPFTVTALRKLLLTEEEREGL